MPDARERGRRLYLVNCALCHGVRADGRGVRRSAFTRPPQDFTDPAWRHGVTAGEVQRTIRIGVPGSAMPAWKSLTDDQVRDLAAYVISVAEEAR